MTDREKVIKGLEICQKKKRTGFSCFECPYAIATGEIDDWCIRGLYRDALALLKEHKNEYENGFNDAMLGKQELMYEGTDGKWHKKDW